MEVMEVVSWLGALSGSSMMGWDQTGDYMAEGTGDWRKIHDEIARRWIKSRTSTRQGSPKHPSSAMSMQRHFPSALAAGVKTCFFGPRLTLLKHIPSVSHPRRVFSTQKTFIKPPTAEICVGVSQRINGGFF